MLARNLGHFESNLCQALISSVKSTLETSDQDYTYTRLCMHALVLSIIIIIIFIIKHTPVKEQRWVYMYIHTQITYKQSIN